MQTIRVSANDMTEMGSAILNCGGTSEDPNRLVVGESIMLAIFDKWGRWRGSVKITRQESGENEAGLYVAEGTLSKPGSIQSVEFSLEFHKGECPVLSSIILEEKSSEEWHSSGCSYTKANAPPCKSPPMRPAARKLSERAQKAMIEWKGMHAA